MKHLFIVNPAAGRSDKTEYVADKVAGIFSDCDCDYEIYVTKKSMDACEKIRNTAVGGEELRVYACGGDGTLNECVNGAVGLPNVAVSHFPCGTGNDFVKMFGEEKNRFFDLKELVDGEIRPIDIIKCNERYSIDICSVGVDARIGTEVHKYSDFPLIGGKGGYIISTVVNVIKGINREFRVKINEMSFNGEMSLICACNGRYYGGSFNPMPTARPDDGILEFLLVKGVSPLTFARLVGGYAKGRFADYPELITHIRGTELEIDAGGEEIVINLDGEALRGKSVKMKLIPGGVNFIFPVNMDFFNNNNEQ